MMSHPDRREPLEPNECPGTILTVDQGWVRWISIVRPERSGAIDEGTAQALVSAFHAFDMSSQRVAVLAGTAPHFSAGADIRSFVGELHAESSVELLEAALLAPARTDKPVIAMITGACFGGGLSLALACDVRVAAPGITLGSRAVHQGLFAFGAVGALLREAGSRVATRLLLQSIPVSSEEAVQLGLLDEVVELRDLERRVSEIASDLTTASSTSMMATKRLLNAHRYASFELEREAMLKVMRSPDAAVGRQAFLDGNQPTFPDPWTRT